MPSLVRGLRSLAVTALLAVAVPPRGLPAQRYDPLAVGSAQSPAPIDVTIRDEARSRAIPIRIYLPAGRAPAPVVLFSHGLGGSRTGSTFLGQHWAARGYAAVFVQHPGSDESIWKDKPPAQRMAALRQAADARNFLLRVQDIPAVLNELDKLSSGGNALLAGRLDLTRVGMSGHSFGATTTQAVSGESFPLGRSFTDPRIKAAVIFSPSSGRGNRSPEKAFGGVRLPWLLMTGTKDVAPIGDQDVASRLRVFPALPPGTKYELVLDGAEHSIFTDGRLAGEQGAVNPNHHRVILALSTAFWDATLRGDAAARVWLDGDGPRTVLEPRDSWKRK